MSDGSPPGNERLPSTHWKTESRMVRVRRQAESTGLEETPPSVGSTPRKSGWRGLPPVDLKRAREPLTLRITYRGGPECWYQIESRGRVGRLPGHVALHDVMRAVYGQD